MTFLIGSKGRHGKSHGQAMAVVGSMTLYMDAIKSQARYNMDLLNFVASKDLSSEFREWRDARLTERADLERERRS